jgi:hypothetical protein
MFEGCQGVARGVWGIWGYGAEHWEVSWALDLMAPPRTSTEQSPKLAFHGPWPSTQSQEAEAKDPGPDTSTLRTPEANSRPCCPHLSQAKAGRPSVGLSILTGVQVCMGEVWMEGPRISTLTLAFRAVMDTPCQDRRGLDLQLSASPGWPPLQRSG